MKNKRALTVVVALVLAVGCAIGGTIAYLTSTDQVVNTFTVGDVAITLDEAKVNPDGSLVEGAGRVQANSYKLMPGKTYIKDPTVHVDADSEDSYLFVKVENGIANIEGEKTIAKQMTEKGWTPVANTTDIYAYKDIVNAGTDVIVFDNFTVAGTVEGNALADYADKTITVTAYAIQADGFDNAADAWAAAKLA